MDDLVKYRLDMAIEHLDSAKILLDAGKYKDSIGRSYYAIFSSMRAVLATRDIDFSKHAGVISYFQKEYIKTGIFEKKYSQYIQGAFQIRNNCDYNDFYVVSAEDAKRQYLEAEEMLKVIAEYLNKMA